jgi:hypothetical protein
VKDKETGEETKEVEIRSGSIPNEEGYTFKDTKTGEEITPAFIFEDTKNHTKKHMIFKDAMSLSSKLKYTDETRTTESELYQTFKKEFVPPSHSSEDDGESSSSTSSPRVMSRTAAEKEEEKVRKAAEKAEEKERKRLEKEEEKERKRLEKEEEKARKAAEKEEEKARKAAPKAAPKAATAATASSSKDSKDSKATTATKPATSTKPTAPEKAATAASSADSKAAKPVTKKTVKAAPKKVEEWTIPNDGNVHPWTFKGKKYAVNYDRHVWKMTEDEDLGDWVGLYLPEEDRIDETVPEPEYDE